MKASRDPRVAAPRAVIGPILLRGQAVCASCQGAITLKTGTSKSPNVHRNYSCSTCARNGRLIPMGKIDDLLTDHLIDRLLQPQRLNDILYPLAERRAQRASETDKRATLLQSEVIDAEERLKRFYCMVEDVIRIVGNTSTLAAGHCGQRNCKPWCSCI